MTKSNLEQLLEKYAKHELSGTAYVKLERWLEVMQRNKIPGRTFALPDDERLYRLLISSKSTMEDIDAFRPYSFDPPSRFSDPWVQILISFTLSAGMIIATLCIKN